MNQQSHDTSSVAETSHDSVARWRRRGSCKPWLSWLALMLVLAPLTLGFAGHAFARSQGTSQITIRAFTQIATAGDTNGKLGARLDNFTYIVNVDNAHYAENPDPSQRPGVAAMESTSPLVANGDQNRATLTLPDGNYLISIRSPDHKEWGKHIILPADAGNVDIGMWPQPLPLGRIRFFAFNDDHWTNGAPDAGEAGVEGFHVTLEDQIDGQVSTDWYGNPLCTNYRKNPDGTTYIDPGTGKPVIDASNPGGDCVTGSDGKLLIDNLGPGTYFGYVTPPDSSWTQTTTIDGGLSLTIGVEEGSDGQGAPGELIWEGPDGNVGQWYGFVKKEMAFADTTGTGSVSGTARNWQGWPPFDQLIMGDPVQQPYIALSDSTSDTTLYVGRGDTDGNFNIPNVPAGSYTLAIWDAELNYIMRFVNLDVAAGQDLNLGDVGVPRWFGWLSGYVYWDNGIAKDGTPLPSGSAGNGIRDCVDPYNAETCEAPIPNFPMDQRWRDGSMKEDTVTNKDGFYEYKMAEGGALGKWFIGEVGFTRFATESGASVHDEIDPSKVTNVCASPPGAAPADCTVPEGGGLLTNQLVTEGHRSWVDWGKRAYGEGDTGQIVGITYFATTRNEFYGDLATNEPYEAAIPDVQVILETPGPDGKPNTADDVVVNNYITDHWQHPSAKTDGQTCDLTDVNGNDLTAVLNPLAGPNCLEVPMTGNETKDGAFNGGYAFADYCPNGYDFAAPNADLPCWNAVHTEHVATESLTPGTYITHAVMPQDATDSRPCNADPNTTAGHYVSEKADVANGAAPQKGCLYRIEAEEDVNVDLGNQFVPQIPPPPCAGDMHLIDQSTLTSRSPYFGLAPSDPKATQPLCDKKVVELKAKQNANADFFLMTNFKNGPDVEVPGRISGLVSDDIYFDRNPHSIWYGEPRPVPNIPVGIRDYRFRLLKTINTDENGAYEALLPSMETYNCPIPQGPCPNMYVIVVNDPGDIGHPNPNFDPNYLTASTAWEVWPAKTTQLDTPLDPISGTGCELANSTPELLQVSRPYVRPTDNTAALRRITIQGDSFGATPGRISVGGRTFNGLATAAQLANLNTGGIVSWDDRQIVLQIPLASASFMPGPQQLVITGSNGLRAPEGITMHVLGTVGTTDYTPPIVNVAKPTIGGHELQDAIDAAAPRSLVVLNEGTYQENVIMGKPLMLQGLGPGGLAGAHELLSKTPEDPRFNILGSSIDGRFFRDLNAVPGRYWDKKLASIPFDSPQPATEISKGADITVVAKSSGPNAFGEGLNAARIDGLTLTMGNGSFGAGGVHVNAWANNLQITNDIFESNHGRLGGAITLGTPNVGDNHNRNVLIKYDRILGNGGVSRAGAVGIYNGANSYEVSNSILCSNASVEYGAGLSQFGYSPNGSIQDNKIYYNDAVDSGAAIALQGEPPQPANGTLGPGTGPERVVRNMLDGNYSGDDGGGIYINSSQSARIDVVNNMITDNGAAHMGGGIFLQNAQNVAIVNNTVANNVTTSSNEGSDGLPHGAGLATEKNSTPYQATLPPGSKDFSDPVALVNNIFWNNQAFTLDTSTVPPGLISNGFMDFEVHASLDPGATFTPRYSALTNAYGPPGQGNIIGVDPLFVAPYILELAVAPSRLNAQQASVTIVRADPPVGIQGNYHLQTGSPVIDRGVACSNTPVPAAPLSPAQCAVAAPLVDYDGDSRPQLRTQRVLTPWDLGADEVPGRPVFTTININSGGPALTTTAGTAFIADRFFTGGMAADATTPNIGGTNDPALYRDERCGAFSYAIPVAPGVYDVRLHFTELYFADPCVGKRIFSMDIRDTPASPDISNQDICATAPGANMALVRTINNVTVSDGLLDIASVYGSADDPELAAIEVFPAGTAPPQPPPAAVRVNSGGPAYTSAAGASFLADAYFAGGTNNWTLTVTGNIANTSDPALYRNERAGALNYGIPVANGTYDVKLHFVEIFFAAPCVGKRIFSVDVLDTPGPPDIAKLDICASAGGPRRALVRTISGVTVTDGVLNLRGVYGAADDPEIAAIEVIPH